MRALTLVMIVGLTFPAVVRAEGALDFLDPCKKEEKRFKSTTEAIRTRVADAKSKAAAWDANPDTLPDNVLLQYRGAVRAFALKSWLDSASGQELVKTWKLKDQGAISKRFFDTIYAKDVPEETEKKIARMLFKQDYAQNIKPDIDKKSSEIDKTINDQKQKLDKQCSPAVFDQVLRGTVGNLVMIVDGNFKAAKNEKGEIAKYTRALSGISITDIMKYGLRGGENSEVRKLQKTWTGALDGAGIGPNNELRKFLAAVDPTNLPTPKSVQINIDSGTGRNVCRNLTFGVGCR